MNLVDALRVLDAVGRVLDSDYAQKRKKEEEKQKAVNKELEFKEYEKNFKAQKEQEHLREEKNEQRRRLEEKYNNERLLECVIAQLCSEVGGDFEKANTILHNYKEKLASEFESCMSIYFDKKIAFQKIIDLANEKQTLMFEQWDILKKDELVDQKEDARKYLSQKYDVFCIVFESTVQELLSDIYKEKTNGKQWLLKTLDDINFFSGLHLLKEFKNRLYELNRLNQEEPRIDQDSIKEYILFYDYGTVLIQKKLNELNWNKEKVRYIDEKKYNEALIYFYEMENIEEIHNLLKKETYIKNRNKGSRGEEEVDYALSWLPEGYINIPQQSVGRYDQKCILLQNANYKQAKQEFDHIIVGPQGVFLIETKNFAGEITIDEDGNWIRKKDGEVKTGERNPIQQVRRHEKLMKSIVNDVPVISIICLSHPKVVVHGANNASVKILKSDLLCEYIENYKAENGLSADEIRAVADKIIKHIA